MQDILHQATECIICHRSKFIGIRVCGQFICNECEREIVKTDVSDPRYFNYVEGMKRIWFAAIS